MIAARTVEERCEFVDPAVLEKPDGFTRSREVKLLVGQGPILAIPVLATLKRIGRLVEFSSRSLPDSAEVG